MRAALPAHPSSRALPVVRPADSVASPPLPGVVAEAERLAGEAIGPRDIRAVKTLRISVTDRCNFRCVYCMPQEGLQWLPRESLLRYEEIVEIARAAIELGIRNFKITGGEPLVRADVAELAAMLRALPGCGELSLTTNGLLLEGCAGALRDAGVARLTVSMDTLRPDRFRAITRTGDLAQVWRGVAAVEAAGMTPVKLNVVVLRDYNLDELADFAALTLTRAWSVRFIEFMPLARSKALTGADQFVPYADMRAAIERVHGPLQSDEPDVGYGPARTFRLRGGVGRVGFIHAMSAPFCSTCNRLRLTPDGELRSCLFDGGEIHVRDLVRPVVRPARLRQAFINCVVLKPDRHAMYGNRQMSQIGG